MPPRPQPQPGKTYRGRRRLPKIPVRRLAKVMSTALMGAVVVALAAGAVMPHLVSRLGTEQGTSILSLSDQFDSADKAARAKDEGPALSVDPGARDLWLLPLRFKYYVSSPYGLREGGEFHYGNDLAAPTGTPTYAVHAGTILIAGVYGGYGLCTMIDVGNGVTIVYGHSSLLLTTVGQHVKAGDKIAEVGSTGESTGPHLHFEIRVNGGETDPTPFMRARGVDIPNRTDQITGPGGI
jgi:murein DD-endopeptidase MepM/ murein hydrolase activator NlpD